MSAIPEPHIDRARMLIARWCDATIRANRYFEGTAARRVANENIIIADAQVAPAWLYLRRLP